MVRDPRQGEVWLADMGLAGKRRPVVVMLSDGVAVERALIIQVPITTQNRGSVFEVAVGHLPFLDSASVANVQALGALPRARFERRLGEVSADDLARIKDALRLACSL